MAALYRLQQGVRALLAFTQDVDYTRAADYLTEPQLAFFRQMTRSEQLHSLRVLKHVLSQEPHTPRALALAALLHDVGKVRYRMRVWQRTMVVLTQHFAPRWYARWAAEEQTEDWRAPFAVHRYHPAWGADILAQTGAPAEAVWLVAHHQDAPQQWAAHPLYPLLLRLQQADNVN